MSGLLSEAEKREIRDAVKSVTDTFMDTPIYYHVAGGSLDRWEEDRSEQKYDTYYFKVLMEEPKVTEVDKELAGSFDFGDVMLTLNLEDLEALDLINQYNKAKFVAETDYFTIKGLVYQVTDIAYDGPLDRKDVLVIIRGKLVDTPIEFDTITIPDSTGNRAKMTIDEFFSKVVNSDREYIFELTTEISINGVNGSITLLSITNTNGEELLNRETTTVIFGEDRESVTIRFFYPQQGKLFYNIKN